MRRKDANLGPRIPRNVRADAEWPSALTCADVRAREWDFVEGALPLPERAAVQAHLDACEACRHSVSLSRNAETALRSGPQQIPPAGDLRTGFYARLAAEQSAPRRFGRPVALSALAAGLLAVVLLRPMLSSHPGVPTSADRTGAPLAVNTLSAPATHAPDTSDTSARNETNAALALAPHSVPGLPEAQVDRLLQDMGRRYPTLLHRHGTHTGRTARLAARPNRTAANRTFVSRTTVAPVPAQIGAKPNEAHSVVNGVVAARDRRETGTLQFDGGANDFAANSPRSSRSLNTDSAKSQLDKESRSLAQSEANEKKSGDHIEVSAMAEPQPSIGISLAVTDDVRGFTNKTHIAADVEEQGDSKTFHISAGDSSN